MYKPFLWPKVPSSSSDNRSYMATKGDNSSFIPISNVDVDESSPLLQRTPTNVRALRVRSSSLSSPSPSPTLGSESAKEESMNKAQLTMICFMRLMDPINFSQLFPYINEYITFLGIVSEIEKVGFYSGLVVSQSISLHDCASKELDIDVSLDRILCLQPPSFC